MPRNVLIVPFLALLLACGASLADQEKEARAALDGRDFAKARSLAEAALAGSDASKDAPGAWRIEQIRMEALANDKQGAELASTLERLAGKYPTQVTAALYRSMADKLKTAGDNSGAIDVLSASASAAQTRKAISFCAGAASAGGGSSGIGAGTTTAAPWIGANSTRRFDARPLSVLLLAIGFASP